MVEPLRFHRDVVINANAAFINGEKVALGFHFFYANWKIGGRHLLFHHAFQTVIAGGGVENETVVRVFVERPEKRNSLDVVPVKMRNKNMSLHRLSCRCLSQVLA